MRRRCCRLWSWSEPSQLLVLAFCAQGNRGFRACPELPALPLPIRTLEVWIPEATTFAHLAPYNGRKKFVVLFPWRLMLARKGNSWIWMLVCLLIYLLLRSTVGKYSHLPPGLVKPLYSSAGTRVQNWAVIIFPRPGSLLVLSAMLRGWEKTREGFARKKWPPSFSKAATTSSFLASPQDVSPPRREAGLPHIGDGAAGARLASLNGEGMPCHPACSPCLLLYPVCELLTLIAPAPHSCSPPSSKLQDGLVFLGIRQREGFLLIGINNLKGHIFPPLQRELGCVCLK